MRHDADLLANARVVAPNELARIIDAMVMAEPTRTRRENARRFFPLAGRDLP